MRVAAIDLGSNSFHMLVAEILGPSSFEIVVQDKMMIQMGKMALVTGRLDPRSMADGLRCLEQFRRLALARRVERTFAVATSAIREAENGGEFLERARRETGLAVRVLRGKEEARLIHLAVSRHIDLGNEKALLIDIGGGSVELTVGDASAIYFSASLKLGFLRLQGRFVSTDPMTKPERRKLTEFARSSLAAPLAAIGRHNLKHAVATSGSVTSLLRLVELRRGGAKTSSAASQRLTRVEVQAILSDLLELSAVDRVKKFDLDPLRAEYLPTALLCLDAILQGARIKELTVCPVALREGLIYDFLLRAKPGSAAPKVGKDLRLRAVVDLASRCDYPIDHSHQVAKLANQIFRQTSALHGLNENHARLLEYAAILHDIGYHIGYAKHHKHAYYLVMNCDLRGFTPEERRVLANLVRYHRRAMPKSSHPAFAALDGRARKVVRYLTAILRIADGLDRSHFSVVEQVQCALERRRARFTVFTNAGRSNIGVDLWAAKKHARYFEKLFDVAAVFVARKLPVSAPARKPRVTARA